MVCIGADAKLCGTRDENNIINVGFKKNGRLWADSNRLPTIALPGIDQYRCPERVGPGRVVVCLREARAAKISLTNLSQALLACGFPSRAPPHGLPMPLCPVDASRPRRSSQSVTVVTSYLYTWTSPFSILLRLYQLHRRVGHSCNPMYAVNAVCVICCNLCNPCNLV